MSKTSLTRHDVARLVKFLLYNVAYNIERYGHGTLILSDGLCIRTWELRNLAAFGIPDELPLLEGWDAIEEIKGGKSDDKAS